MQITYVQAKLEYVWEQISESDSTRKTTLQVKKTK